MLVVFHVRKKFFDALAEGKKKIELRIGEKWLKIAEKIQEKRGGIALFKWSSKTIIREIWKVEVYPNIRTALGSGRWRLLGLDAKTYPEAIDEIRKIYAKVRGGKVVLFWLRQPKDREQIMESVAKLLREKNA